jgi:calcium and integrin-binding protein 2
MQDLRNINELLYNPFAGRIAEVFSDDGTGRLTFKNFLELFAVFSPQANFDVKVIFLFAIWDFDGATHAQSVLSTALRGRMIPSSST